MSRCIQNTFKIHCFSKKSDDYIQVQKKLFYFVYYLLKTHFKIIIIKSLFFYIHYNIHTKNTIVFYIYTHL